MVRRPGGALDRPDHVSQHLLSRLLFTDSRSGLVPFATAIIGVWLPIQAYIIDAYPQHAASGLAAFSVLRSTVAAFLPLAGPKMYESLGIGWGTSLLGFIAIALIPIPTIIYKYGKRLRQKYPLEL